MDLTDQYEIEDVALDYMKEQDWIVYRTSAKTGQSVEEAFLTLAGKMVEA
jgi:predicted transcriptional regulator